MLTHWSSWWHHQMETFSVLLAIRVGNSAVTGEFPSQRPVTFSLICAWISDWINNHEAGDLRRHRAHYDVIVMYWNLVLTSDGLSQDCSNSSANALELLQPLWSHWWNIMYHYYSDSGSVSWSQLNHTVANHSPVLACYKINDKYLYH